MAQNQAGAVASSSAPARSSANSTIKISRNKHWKYISQLHGPWVQLDIDKLESLAQQNFTHASPRLFDPGVVFDVVKIRKRVDNAAAESIRAAMGIAYTHTTGRQDYYAGTIPKQQMSKERIHKIRQGATTQLAKAYQLDDVIASVAAMHASAGVLDTAEFVAKREPKNIGAQYVQFFHEKIPMHNVEHNTFTEPLDAIIDATPYRESAPILRTRALTHLLKNEVNEAITDLSRALSISDGLRVEHMIDQDKGLIAKVKYEQYAFFKKDLKGNRNSIPPLREEDQPTGLHAQLLLHRADAYLTLACQSIERALDGLPEYFAAKESGELTQKHRDAHAVHLEARTQVKGNAQRALKDFLAFLSRLEYTPGLPSRITREIMRRYQDLETGTSKLFIKTDEIGPDGKHVLRKTAPENWPEWPLPRIYNASELFEPHPPSDMPAFPQTPAALDADHIQRLVGYREVVTYHPLLEEVLNSLLLAHALLQTSPTEVRRHALNVARLSFISRPAPIFSENRTVAKADFGDILTKIPDWLKLEATWSDLCASLPPVDAQHGVWSSKTVDAYHNYKQKRDAHDSLMDTLVDERVFDEESFHQAMVARQARNKRPAAPAGGFLAIENGVNPVPVNERQGFIVASKRAQLILRWIAEAPQSLGVKKKRPTRKKKLPVLDEAEALIEKFRAHLMGDDHRDG